MKKLLLLSIMFAILVFNCFVVGYGLGKYISENKQVNVVAKDFEKQDMFQIGDDLKPRCEIVWYTINKVTINTDYKKELEDELGKFNIYKIDSVVFAKDEHKAYSYVCYAHIELDTKEVEYLSEYELKEATR